MKIKNLCFCLIIIIIRLSYNAQWVQQNSGTTNTLWQVHFLVQDTGYVVGFNDTVLKTTDGGTNWNYLNIGTSDNL
ncbi:MAG: hypothetical protein IIA45_08025 [Bacteroidetes bacterium]|nr:hypothetical protein [Bacteroidota bacterium]